MKNNKLLMVGLVGMFSLVGSVSMFGMESNQMKFTFINDQKSAGDMNNVEVRLKAQNGQKTFPVSLPDSIGSGGGDGRVWIQKLLLKPGGLISNTVDVKYVYDQIDRNTPTGTTTYYWQINFISRGDKYAKTFNVYFSLDDKSQALGLQAFEATGLIKEEKTGFFKKKTLDVQLTAREKRADLWHDLVAKEIE